MRTIGLLGGMSWYSTLEYYRVINTIVQQELGGHASAPIVLQSLNFAEVRACQLHEDWDRAADLLVTAARRCEAAGADAVMIATNLMHKVFEPVQASIDVPMLHVGDAIAQVARSHGWHSVGLLGTRWVMEETFYIDRLTRHGLTVHVPPAAERLQMDQIIFDELTQGEVHPASQRRGRAMVADLRAGGAQAVVLGCTEIELLLDPDNEPAPLLDSMRAHAEAAAAFVLNDTLPQAA